MPPQTWTLCDIDRNEYLETLDFSESLKGSGSSESVPVRISKRRLRGGLSDGVDLVEIDNGRLSLSVLPTRGMGIWRGRCGDVELKWNSPVAGPVNPAFVPIADPGGFGWLEGFDEWLVRCGLDSNGSPEHDEKGVLQHSLHGRVANIPAGFVSLTVDPESGKIELGGKVREAKVFFKQLELTTTLTTFAGSSRFTIRDTVANLSDEPGEFELLYHINTGQPFASPGGRVVVPFERMAPRTQDAVENLANWDRLDPETPGSNEVVFFFEVAADPSGDCKTMLVNPAGDRGLALAFNRNEFPYFSFWKSRLSDADGYVCGLEPSVNFPNPKSFEKKQGRVVSLRPRESRTFTLNFEVLHDADAVQRAEREIQGLPAARTIEPTPRPDWSC